MADYPIGKADGFRKYIEGLLNKPKVNSQKSFMNFLKRLGQKYRSTGKPIKIIDVYKDEAGNVSFCLEDYSKWKIEISVKPPSWNWSKGDEVIVTGSRGGSGRMEIYNINNISLGDESFCIFQGFLEG